MTNKLKNKIKCWIQLKHLIFNFKLYNINNNYKNDNF